MFHQQRERDIKFSWTTKTLKSAHKIMLASEEHF